MAVGLVKAIRGVVVDVEFPEGELPEIYEALEIQRPDGRLVLEVQQHLGGGLVKTVAMDSTDGLQLFSGGSLVMRMILAFLNTSPATFICFPPGAI